MSHVTEVVLFRLNEGADEAAFIKAANATYDLLATYDGYIEHELSASADGLWVDLVIWRDLPTAEAAAAAIMSTSTGQAFGSFIAPDSIQMTHVHPRITRKAVNKV